jgi:hypothetical protein
MKTKRFDSSKGNVWKYVFDFENAKITSRIQIIHYKIFNNER